MNRLAVLALTLSLPMAASSGPISYIGSLGPREVAIGEFDFTGNDSQRNYYKIRVTGVDSQSSDVGLTYQITGNTSNLIGYFNVFAGLYESEDELYQAGISPVGGGTELRGWTLPYGGLARMLPGDYTVQIYSQWRGGFDPINLGYRASFDGNIAAVETQSVPEPSTLALVALGFALAAKRRHSNRSVAGVAA